MDTLKINVPEQILLDLKNLLAEFDEITREYDEKSSGIVEEIVAMVQRLGEEIDNRQ